MCGNLNRRPVGRCSQCGGVVSVPVIFHSVCRPVPSCESCGAVMDEAHGLPVVPTRPVRKHRRKRQLAVHPVVQLDYPPEMRMPRWRNRPRVAPLTVDDGFGRYSEDMLTGE